MPGLWRPIVGIDAFNLKEYEIDITVRSSPFDDERAGWTAVDLYSSHGCPCFAMVSRTVS